MNTMQAASGKWQGILIALGVDESFLTGKQTPCPGCGGKDRFRYTDYKDDGNFFCNNCGSGNGFDLLDMTNGWDFKQAAKEVDKIVGNVEVVFKTKKDPRILLRKIQKELLPIDGINPVSLYLKRRGLNGSSAIKYHPSLPYYEGGKCLGNHPAMVCQVKTSSGNPSTYHITYLNKQGGKADVDNVKKVMPTAESYKGGGIPLSKPDEAIAICEGIETALAVQKKTGLAAFAAINAGNLEVFEPPECVDHVIIFADNDLNFAGQKSAYVLANRLSLKGFIVDVKIPERVGTDYADVFGEENAK